MMTSSQVRQSFLDFFARRGHRIVPSAPVIPHGDPTLLFTNAGMNQFKDVFLGTGTRDYARAVDTQKCIRVSGKHNDLEEVGRDTYHHTFFEMLGNWSFGDYYKQEAIAWAWELLTVEWGLEKGRLYATVFETDDEAEQLWKRVTDIDPSHVLRFGRKDNFWEMGETGPCGPCSEIHIDVSPDRSGRGLVNAGDPRVMEIWNLVFIQNNRTDSGELAKLPARHVDTGMGFERVCAVLQGKSSNYDTDVFTPIIQAIAGASGRPYAGEENQTAMRVIADHVRMLSFAIADGAIPGNEGRGYVLRRILRRAARFGRNLGMRDPFIHAIARAVGDCMGEAFPELLAKGEHIQKVIRAEEESFNQTLDRGLEIFSSVLERMGHSRVFPGEDAFKLYDTYGFPLDLTQMMAEERGLKVDAGRFTALMEEQRERSRTGTTWSAEGGGAEIEVALASAAETITSEFVGYDAARLEVDTMVLSGIENPSGKTREERGPYLFLDRSPFYAQSGGQVSDVGVLRLGGGSLPVVDAKRIRGAYAVLVEGPLTGAGGRRYAQLPARASVDVPRRMNIQRNHTATHLVHEALRRVLGTHVHQQGSLVAPDHLRFDFPHFGKIKPDEIRAIEEMVNEKIADDIPVITAVDLPIEKARKIPNVKMFFGDKYGEVVRVVFIDEQFSVEFCGGTHVQSTGDCGLFKIVSESSIASGVRRIEAVSGDGLRRYIEGQAARAGELTKQLERLMEEMEALEKELGRGKAGRSRPDPVHVHGGAPSRASIAAFEADVRRREEALEQSSREMLDLRKELSRRRVKEGTSAIEALLGGAVLVEGIRLVAARVAADTMDELKSLGDALRGKLQSGVGVLGAVIDGKAALVCVVTDDLIAGRRLNAGTIVGAMARKVGGGGGGKPHLATAGGKDTAQLDDALRSAPEIIRSTIAR